MVYPFTYIFFLRNQKRSFRTADCFVVLRTICPSWYGMVWDGLGPQILSAQRSLEGWGEWRDWCEKQPRGQGFRRLYFGWEWKRCDSSSVESGKCHLTLTYRLQRQRRLCAALVLLPVQIFHIFTTWDSERDEERERRKDGSELSMGPRQISRRWGVQYSWGIKGTDNWWCAWENRWRHPAALYGICHRFIIRQHVRVRQMEKEKEDELRVEKGSKH